MKTFISIFYLFFLSLFLFTHAHAEKDLNSVLNGTYAYNETWFCGGGGFNVSGIISFDGNGNAEDVGSFSANLPGTINTHTGVWEYEVFENPEDCAPIGVICDFKYSGTRILSNIIGDSDPETEPGLVFYGKIGKRGNGFTGNGNTTDVILIERHDGMEETINEGDEEPGNVFPLGVCDKAGTLVKISDFPQDLVEEGNGFPAENQVGGFPAENQVGGFPAH